MTADNVPGRVEQPRSPILLAIDDCVKRAVSKGNVITLASETHGSFSDRTSFETVLGNYSLTEVENAVTVFGSETLDHEKPVKETTLPPKNGSPNKTVRREWEAKNGTFFLGKETTVDRQDILLNKTYYVRGAKVNLGQKFGNLLSSLRH